MCGLAGFVGAGDRDDLTRMTAALAHRGPDGQGLFQDPQHPVFLGHRRLSIIDIEDGAQPMSSADGRIVVVFNGEIYNHAELRRELEAKGHVFRTDHSDTEVLVHGWHQWGTELPSRLNGMFAFAVWDREQRRLFLARDRFGEKPLYWAQVGGRLLFASELTALAGHAGLTPEIDPMAVRKLLAYGFIPSPVAYWKGCRKLPGGSWLLYGVDDGSLRQGDFWRFRIEPGLAITEKQAVEQLRDLIISAVQRRLMSDVPLGIFLSGGVDSSGVAAAAARLVGGGAVKTFAIGFTEPSYDESAHARRMADYLGTEHHADILTMARAQALIPNVLGRLDEPMGDPSLLPTFLLCRFASQHVKVALSGDGGDELFAGYDTFAALKIARLYRALIRGPLHQGARKLVELLPKSSRNMSFDFKCRRALTGIGSPAELWHPLWLGPLEPAAMAELFEERVETEELYSEALEVWRGSNAPSVMDRSLEFYSRLYLQDNILTKVDRAAMMNGLEVRSVFLDNDLVDFVRQLPHELKYRGGIRKYVLKKALAGLVPEDILTRKKKGFGIPLMDWLKQQDYPGDAVAGARPGVARRWHDRHLAGKADYRSFLWCWTVLSQHNRFAATPMSAETKPPGVV